MGFSDVAKGEEFERKAEKKIKGWGLFGSKYEDAADLYQKVANSFKLSKSWDKAATAYIKMASCYLKSDSKHEAVSAYVDAANCYKKISPKQAVSCLDQAVNLQLEINRLNMAARYSKEIGELYEQEQNLEQAMSYFERAADLFQTEEVNTSASQCKQKVAEFSAQLGKYQKAIQIYEEVARYSLNNNLLKYGARGHLLNAGICQLCKGDVVALNNALDKYQEVNTSASQCKQKVAEFSAQLGKYQKAIQIYEEVARYSLNNNLLKYGARGHLLNAGICQLCKGDVVAINNALDKYQDLDPTFSRTREFKLLADMAVAFDEEDAAKFTIAVKEFDSITKLDSWRTTLLLRVKENIKAKELEDDDDLT